MKPDSIIRQMQKAITTLREFTAQSEDYYRTAHLYNLLMQLCATAEATLAARDAKPATEEDDA